MSIDSRIIAFAQAVGTDIKTHTGSIGTLSALNTTAKTSLVAAVNEVKAAVLMQSSVDNLLECLAALDGTNGTSQFGIGRRVTIKGTSAAPSATGLAAKATLVARGVAVTHN